ncbi:hypothetical protein GCM10023084_69440 [Streptomyces lacrimifluminis]|uniref:Uncharacterized protein n=1 Tax=Streptomyces lacrimifluminis TaxID=1500077 RepID=A0A917LD92_9ACTN|nr:hypothetical protein GCM10012282_66940 [Streptomyces lacrimifluminis]
MRKKGPNTSTTVRAERIRAARAESASAERTYSDNPSRAVPAVPVVPTPTADEAKVDAGDTTGRRPVRTASAAAPGRRLAVPASELCLGYCLDCRFGNLFAYRFADLASSSSICSNLSAAMVR